MWTNVIKVKHLRNRDLVDCIRDALRNVLGVSSCWNNLLSSFLILSQWLAWKLGNGFSVRMGQRSSGGNWGFFRLSNDLVKDLLQKGILYLVQVRSLGRNVISGQIKIYVIDFYLQG